MTTTNRAAVESRTAELKASITEFFAAHGAIEIGSAPYSATLRIAPGGDVWLDGSYPELVDMGDTGCWGQRLDAAIGCLARAIACAEHGYRPALAF